jgi:hypothetical protein
VSGTSGVGIGKVRRKREREKEGIGEWMGEEKGWKR